MVETLDEILRKALEYHGSDVFVVPGSQIMTKANGKMIAISEERALPADIEVLVNRAYELANRSEDTLKEEGDDDYMVTIVDHNEKEWNLQLAEIAKASLAVIF